MFLTSIDDVLPLRTTFQYDLLDWYKVLIDHNATRAKHMCASTGSLTKDPHKSRQETNTFPKGFCYWRK